MDGIRTNPLQRYFSFRPCLSTKINSENTIASTLTACWKVNNIKEPLSWIFENDCSYGVEYGSKGMKTSCKDLYLKVHRI